MSNQKCRRSASPFGFPRFMILLFLSCFRRTIVTGFCPSHPVVPESKNSLAEQKQLRVLDAG